MLKRECIILVVAASVPSCGPFVVQEGELKTSRDLGNRIAVATLGMNTRAPSKREADSLGLDIEVRIKGQLISHIAEGGAAARAGLEVGDVVEKLDENEVFSRDDVRDFLLVGKPGQRVSVQVLRSREGKRRRLQVELGSKIIEARGSPRLGWRFAGLGQLEDAIEKAKEKGRLLLIGLSGAET